MHTRTESASCVYEGDKLVAIIKMDEKSRHALVYNVEEAGVEDIAQLINGEEKDV